MDEQYWSGLAKQIDLVFQAHPSLYDHRRDYTWLTGALGDPHSGIWFIAENPSLGQIERVQNRTEDRLRQRRNGGPAAVTSSSGKCLSGMGSSREPSIPLGAGIVTLPMWLKKPIMPVGGVKRRRTPGTGRWKSGQACWPGSWRTQSRNMWSSSAGRRRRYWITSYH